MRAGSSIVAALLAFLGSAAAASDAVWDKAYDAATGTRYIPLELILGAPWDGEHRLQFPRGRYSEDVARDPSTWSGPVEWRHPDTGQTLQVYDRTRRGVAQKFAVRTDGAAIGRVADTRYGISSCDQEAKYPLGVWKQGETREFRYRCWYGTADRKRERPTLAVITIEEIDFAYAGAAHALRLRWILKQDGAAREIDNRVYVFAPGRGAVYVSGNEAAR